MTTKTIDDLRIHLFDTLEALKNDKNPMDIERAKAIAEVAQTVINSAKVEVEHMKLTGGKGSAFIQQALPPPRPGEPRLVRGKDATG